MAEIIFNCPSCSQSIAADDQWAGQAVQCPHCQTPVSVPARGDQPSSLVPQPPTSATPKLSVGQSKISSAQAAQERKIPIRNINAPARKKENKLLQFIAPALLLIILGAAAYMAYPYISKKVKKSAEQLRAETGNVETPPPAEAAPPAEPVEKPLPVIAPAYHLDLAEAEIPKSRLNGQVGGTNFAPESLRLDAAAGVQVLRFTEGALTSPEREILIYLRPKPGAALAGEKFSISKEMRGAGVPQISKRWKSDPRYAAQIKTYSTGYAMKLEFGEPTAEGVLPGKIYLALPDPEKSVVAGLFKAVTNAAAPAMQSAQPVPGMMNPAQAAERAAFEKRYGVGR